jgi:HD-GYP domain-containing protein (c-di-GMP phosphodiesterase class II)
MEMLIDRHRLLSALSLCLDFTGKGLHRHHQRVAFISSVLAEEMGLSYEEKHLAFISSIIHDIGVSTWHEKGRLAEYEVENPWAHCLNGFEMVGRVDFLRPAADIILHHHDRFGGDNQSGLSGGSIPLAARIVHLADRVDILIKQNTHILIQSDEIIRSVKKLAGNVFDPELVTAFTGLARRESFWLELISPFSFQNIIESCTAPPVNISEKEIKQAAGMFAETIDKKSPYTHRHSRRVAGVAVLLAAAAGLGADDIFLMEISGLFHDLGKLSIPDEILEKPDSLTPDEFAVIRQHTFYTFRILQEGGVTSPLPEWAAYHHERLDGRGYPFHLDAPRLSQGSRIMSVADVFTALREDRPYRAGMERKQIEEIMRKMAVDLKLDGQLTALLFDIYDEVDKLFNI